MNKTLSVVIPTFKRTDSLIRLIELLNKQTIADHLQIIIIDQNIPGFLENHIKISDFANIKYVYQEQPNVSLARNTGAKLSNCEYILFLDDDVLPDNDFCEAGIRVLNSEPDIDVLSPVILRHGDKVSEILPENFNKEFCRLSLKEKYLHASFFTISACTFYRKEAFYRSGGFDPQLFKFSGTAEDLEFFIRLVKKGISTIVTNTIQILIDETVSGGCDLRTVDYWVTREKCIKSWIFRYKTHRGGNLKLSFMDFYYLLRSIVINKVGLTSGFNFFRKQIKLFNSSLKQASQFLESCSDKYKSFDHINHL